MVEAFLTRVWSMYIKSPLNYIGAKYKLLDRIIPILPQESRCFVDLFTGGMNVGINVNADIIYANDHIDYLIELYDYFKRTPTGDLRTAINEVISNYSLNKQNVDGYSQLRQDYNTNKSPLFLFVLTCFSFNHQIRFNNSFMFNMPFGRNRSSYNANIETNLIRFSAALKEKNVILSSCDFRSFDFSKIEVGSVVYCDPPYLISTGSYNDGKRGFGDWTKKDDYDLYMLLDKLNDKGLLFALSNVFYHKGLSNDELIRWSEKYNVTYVDADYSNCAYNKKDKKAKSVEVLITNFAPKKRL